MHYDVKISGAWIRTHDLWIQKRVCCPLHLRASLLQQLREEEKSELEQKHEQATAKELINEASTKMTATIDQKNMQSVQVAQTMLKAGNEKLH